MAGCSSFGAACFLSMKQPVLTDANVKGADGCVGLMRAPMDILSSNADFYKRSGVICVSRDNTDLKDRKRLSKKSCDWLKTVTQTKGEIL